MSRARHRNHLYVVATAPDPTLPAPHDDTVQRLHRRLRISQAKTLATDDMDLGLEIA